VSSDTRVLEQLSLLGDARRIAGDPETAAVVIRPSSRARRMILRVLPPYELELVVPRGTRPRVVEAFLHSNRDWIRRARRELSARYPAERRSLPAEVRLEAIGQVWTVRAVTNPLAAPRLRVRRGSLELSVPGGAPDDGFEQLRRWLRGQGRKHLAPWLAAEAARLRLKPRRIQIRTQRTRWGSCSQHGTISLNAAVLLLPAHLVRYLLVHELCHLRHLNHSSRYWRLVERHEPAFRVRDRALAAAWADIPAWALPR
jgi:predicted metal-dependent hydrolase